MLNPLRGALHAPDRNKGTVNLNLVLVIAFAMLALLMLTWTWFSSRHIAGNFVEIDKQTAGIAADTEQADRLFRTSELTGDIERQTEPLADQARSIDRSVSSISSSVRRIENNALVIRQHARTITESTGDIEGIVTTLHGTVRGIEAKADAIRANVAGTHDSFTTLYPVTRQILNGPDPIGVDNINRNTDQVISKIRATNQNLRELLPTVKQVDRHAYSICQALIIDIGGGC